MRRFGLRSMSSSAYIHELNKVKQENKMAEGQYLQLFSDTNLFRLFNGGWCCLKLSTGCMRKSRKLFQQRDPEKQIQFSQCLIRTNSSSYPQKQRYHIAREYSKPCLQNLVRHNLPWQMQTL